MMRFAARHWTGILILIVVGWWALIYVPASPSFAVFQLKRAIDARDGEEAARYVNFESVVKQAGYEMVQQKANDPLSQMVGQGAVDLFLKPLAQATRSYLVKDVNDGDKNVQMPPAAVAGAVILMHRDEGVAYTKFTDNKNRQWEVRMARDQFGVWQVTEVKNIQQLLDQIQHDAQKRLDQEPPPPEPEPSP
ncbi:MAG TPA: DUF2939 domain-containing protein [Candidatus Binataceae bacterium]|nr:DUF2939 domain-containing protein [Candidatus Binataceae bacterium]